MKNTLNQSFIIDINGGPYVKAQKGKSLDENTIRKSLKEIGIEAEIKRLKTSMTSSSPGLKGNTKTESVEKFEINTNISESEISPWDLAYTIKRSSMNTSFIEPNLISSFPIEESKKEKFENISLKEKPNCSLIPTWDNDWEAPNNFEFWHLDDRHSQLRSARNQIKLLNNEFNVRIAHFDTGFDPNHPSLPDNMLFGLQRSFVEGEVYNDATDKYINGISKNPGHGTGTLGILAGKLVDLNPSVPINEEVGGAPFANIVPIRIANSVILLKNSAFYNALMYITELTRAGINPVHVLTMSMGGLASKAWADAVNAAYEAGIFMVTAAGNNFGRFTPTHLIYPARFNRVVAACGVTYDDKPYKTRWPLTEMQGNYGPNSVMGTAMAAYTPNTPWAEFGCSTISFEGAGTSSATPQIAAAAACYWKKHHEDLNSFTDGWKKVEAIRHALFTSAYKGMGTKGDYKTYFGNGILQSNDALNIPVKKSGLKMSEADDVRFPLFNVLLKSQKAIPISPGELGMIQIELAQIVQKSYSLQSILNNKDFTSLAKKEKSEFLSRVIGKEECSSILKKFSREHLLLLNKK